MNLKKEMSVAKIVKDTEGLFRGGFFCLETVVCSIRSNFEVDALEGVIAMASGFPIGTGRSKCLCGAVSGNVMAIGLVFGRMVQKGPQVEQTLALSKELHDWFKAANGKNVLCCRILTKESDMGVREHKEQCIHFTGLVVGKVVEVITREEGLTNIDEQECALMIKKIPPPATGVMLDMAVLGNLLQSHSEGVCLLCGAVSLILGILIVIKIILYPRQFARDMKNPIMASVSGTFPTAVMLLAGHVKLFVGSSAVIIWYAGIGLHIVFTVHFTTRFMIHLRTQQVFASYYIVYVGIATVSVTAPAFDKLAVGIAVFWFGSATTPILLVLVTYHYVNSKQAPEPAQPLPCIYTALISLCPAGRVQSVQSKSLGLTLLTMILSSIIYIAVLIKTPVYPKMEFYPSYAAFTFPFVVTATGLKMAMACLSDMGHPVPALSYAVAGETVIVSIFTIYALMRYGTVVLERGH